MRSAFQRDRDRILHSKSFRRLQHKTQVFLSPEGDHYRTRMTHTLEVMQIARTISRALQLNEDLAEAIAMAHDMGHSPFGHVGEKTIATWLPQGFEHYRQSLRVVEQLEDKGKGLNLTLETKNGIIKHSKGKGGNILGEKAMTLEAEVVRAADILAYINHDLDDAFRAGVITPGDVPENYRKKIGNTVSERLSALVSDIVEASRSNGLERIAMTPDMLEIVVGMREFMFESVYESDFVQREFKKTAGVLNALYEFISKSPDTFVLPYPEEDSLNARVVDFIAGMTDRYAIRLYQELFVPRGWGNFKGESVL